MKDSKKSNLCPLAEACRNIIDSYRTTKGLTDLMVNCHDATPEFITEWAAVEDATWHAKCLAERFGESRAIAKVLPCIASGKCDQCSQAKRGGTWWMGEATS